MPYHRPESGAASTAGSESRWGDAEGRHLGDLPDLVSEEDLMPPPLQPSLRADPWTVGVVPGAKRLVRRGQRRPIERSSSAQEYT